MCSSFANLLKIYNFLFYKDDMSVIKGILNINILFYENFLLIYYEMLIIIEQYLKFKYYYNYYLYQKMFY